MKSCATPVSHPGRTPLYDSLARLYEYPGEDYLLRLEECIHASSRVEPEASAHLENLRRDLEGLSPSDLQEQFTRTFEHNEDCALELGWHVYGETYQRGVFMAEMRELLRRVAVPESVELPDHLSHVLRAVVRAPGRDARPLIRLAVLPALDTLHKNLASKQSPYAALLEATRAVLSKDGAGGERHE